MNQVKMLGLFVVAAAALIAFAGTASATITSGGSAYTGHLHFESSSWHLDAGPITLSCKSHTLTIPVPWGSTTSSISSMTLTECGSDTVSVTTPGSLRIDSNGTVYFEGTEVTAQAHRTVFGFPVTTHCIYRTAANPGTDIGALTEGTTSIEMAGTNIPQVSTDGGCGSNAQWTGTYTITKPGALTID